WSSGAAPCGCRCSCGPSAACGIRFRGVSSHPKLQPIQPDDHVRGPADAAVTVIEYGDYDCPHTRAAQANVDQLVAAGGVRVVFRYFPLRNMHASAEILARLAEAAARQGLFWPMHDHLMSHRNGVQRDDILTDAA